MASFDFARLDPSLYTMSDVNCALDFQIMVQEFMLVVKTNPDFFEKHEKEIKDFCALLEHDDMWQVANAVIPEFRLRQDLDLHEHTPLNDILRNLTHKRPRVPVNDPGSSLEADWLKKSCRDDIEYLETLGLGFSALDGEKQAELEDIVRRTLRMLEN